jgi:hypothetical protein
LVDNGHLLAAAGEDTVLITGAFHDLLAAFPAFFNNLQLQSAILTMQYLPFLDIMT